MVRTITIIGLGSIVLMAGLLAMLGRWDRARWARHWPLAFLGLAVFLFLRADPEAWPLGPRGFWASFYNPEDLQHRLYILLIVSFVAFEWSVQTQTDCDRRKRRWCFLRCARWAVLCC